LLALVCLASVWAVGSVVTAAQSATAPSVTIGDRGTEIEQRDIESHLIRDG